MKSSALAEAEPMDAVLINPARPLSNKPSESMALKFNSPFHRDLANRMNTTHTTLAQMRPEMNPASASRFPRL